MRRINQGEKLMTTKAELQAQLAKQEAETAELRKRIEAMPDDKPTGNPHVFKPQKGDRYWVIRQCCHTGKFEVDDEEGWLADGTEAFGFRSLKAALAWADALNVMMEFRVSEGACEYGETKGIAGQIEGVFETYKYALRALKDIGANRAYSALNTFLGKAV